MTGIGNPNTSLEQKLSKSSETAQQTSHKLTSIPMQTQPLILISFVPSQQISLTCVTYTNECPTN